VHHLKAQMIFFIDHHAETFGRVDHGSPRPFAIGKLATHLLPLDEKLTIDLFQIFNIEVERPSGKPARLSKS
jgi:hypothetical protein